MALPSLAEFAIVDEAYPYVAQRLLCDDEPRLQAALRYMVHHFCSALLAQCMRAVGCRILPVKLGSC